ncbi:ABC transporter ATP-binding protein [Hydrogenimonas urashimensis]|uniref:ABC transporter ATP-binding protein n=1 Tax=Hydrogenimonas urashimensis TaxID=2740515 RepID=UPI001916C793|nr:ATP-binding cassette domain-containing protein [Hydrogenimonas urashimensis]
MILIDILKPLAGSTGKMRLRVKLEIAEKSFVALAGESGSGKTTLLRTIAGLEEAQGTIVVGDEVWLDDKTSLPPQNREIGFVFQDYALFENMTILQNLLFVENDKTLATHLLRLTALEELSHRHPATLSGGQQQRVALCRAMMKRPKLLLMDEPLSALDPAMRNRLQFYILRLHKEFGTTSLMVSHDPSEIYRLADRVVMLDHGQIVRDGTPAEVLLKTAGSQKFSFEGELLDIVKRDVIHVAVIAIGQQIVEVVLDEAEAETLTVGDTVTVSAKAFAPVVSK